LHGTGINLNLSSSLLIFASSIENIEKTTHVPNISQIALEMGLSAVIAHKTYTAAKIQAAHTLK
jgi:hypothetical protein